MLNIFKLLQFFADGDGAAPGVTSDVTGQSMGETTTEAATQEPVAAATDVSYADRLSELGVPKDKIRAKYNKPMTKAQDAAPAVEPQAAAENNDLTWEKVKDLPFVKEEISKIVRSSVEKRNAAKDRLEKLAPGLEVLARQYGMDGSDLDKLDFEALGKAISSDNHYYESKASEMGVDLETARHIDELEREKQRRDRAEAVSFEEQRQRDHFESLVKQGEELKKTFPNFDLRTEMQDPRFVRFTSPGSGLSLKDAYFAIHREEIQNAQAQAIAQGVQQRMSNAYQSGISRPIENGSKSQASSVSKMSYRSMTKADREALRKEIYKASAEGRKLYPSR